MQIPYTYNETKSVALSLNHSLISQLKLEGLLEV